MYLVEKHIISKSHPFYKECDDLCFKSKNIYNQALYNVRQFFFKNSKYLNYNSNYHIAKEQDVYKLLPSKVFCQGLKKVDANFKSFFNALKSYNVNPSKFEEKPRIPKYLDKTEGRFLTIFPKQALGLREFKKSGKIHLSQTNILITTRLKDFNIIKEVRLIPRINYYVIEVVYKQDCKSMVNSNKIAAIDLGLNNLATVAFNDSVDNPLVINGKPLKSINQYYNKTKANLQSKLRGRAQTSKRIQALTNKRNNKISDYLHKSSRILVNQLVSRGVSTLVIGRNTNQKQDINIGKANNQNFTQAPIFKFAELVKYKCELEGIKVIYHEESYTSKCSFFDNEKICKHENYLGKRIKRGLFKTSNNQLVNADVNGAYNILKKAIPNAFADGIEGLGVNPLVITIKK